MKQTGKMGKRVLATIVAAGILAIGVAAYAAESLTPAEPVRVADKEWECTANQMHEIVHNNHTISTHDHCIITSNRILDVHDSGISVGNIHTSCTCFGIISA